ncbi:hypothetical protein [Xenorhabdus innexi]|uniref:Uncharacterized protein n=1 Tax=Xenorhabdus innexi TaxID=290109 RepID=A0A1N6N1X4_9GAMM|nr:hypothetical protein [Xenorhabdus innexi]PHM37149.1 hypothetical protein Xinn_01116 [Xenorhabdus innexi]SIP75070.1 membrane hypothetical protein [Xenorhabdus innexi]
MSGLSELQEATPDLMYDISNSNIMTAMPDAIASIVLFMIAYYLFYLLHIAYIWYITVPLGIISAFLFVKKKSKIFYAFLTLFFLIPPVWGLIFYSRLLFVR